MNYSEIFHFMRPELTLIVTIALLFLFDLFAPERLRRYFHPLACVLLTVQILVNIVPTPDSGQLFGGMYQYEPMQSIVKSMLAIGTLIVFLQSNEWLRREDTAHKRGEFYLLTLSTLLGMYFMISAGNFLMFFLGMELASIPMACLIAFDKYRHNSAEAGAKYILCALFSSGLMLYGISFIYGACGTLYFDDVMAQITATPLTIMGLVFFFSGLGFKISLVPFHFWTADTYQGAPTAVTGYLSVVSKGAAAFALMTILTKVFAPMVEYWEMLMYIVIVLTITIANLFALRQTELKRFMAFSSISQAGYIMLAAVGNGAMGLPALMYYVLIYVAANMAVFTIINVVETRGKGNTEMSVFDGFYTTNPKLSFLMTLALFSLAGIPPFAGMFCKFFVFMAAAEQGSNIAYAVVFLALINTVPSLYYYLKIVKCMYINKTDAPLAPFKSDCATRTALALCTAGVLLFGVCSCVYGWLVAATSAM